MGKRSGGGGVGGGRVGGKGVRRVGVFQALMLSRINRVLGRGRVKDIEWKEREEGKLLIRGRKNREKERKNDEGSKALESKKKA